MHGKVTGREFAWLSVLHFLALLQTERCTVITALDAMHFRRPRMTAPETKMPDSIKAWHSHPGLDHIGTWATTRYPDEAEIYHRADLTIRRDDPVLKQVMVALKYWQSQGCPNCSGDCASANPPVTSCPLRETADALAALKERMGGET